MDERAVDLKAVIAGVGIMVGGIAIALAGAWGVAHRVPSPLAAPNNAERPRIAGPVQRTAPALELAAFLREKNARLHGRGVDATTGEPFIPIEEAMQAMVTPVPGDAPRGRTPR